MSSEIEGNVTSEEAAARKAARKSKPKPAKRATQTKKAAAKLRRHRGNNKAEVLALMKRAEAGRWPRSCPPPAGRRTRYGLCQHPRQQGWREDRVRDE
jgi:hypothetical protein